MNTPVAANKPFSSETRAKPFFCRRYVRITIYTCFALLLVLMLAWRYVPYFLDPTFEKHIQSNRVVVGMTADQVLQAWGGPYTINVSYTDKGVRREEWVYQDWKDAGTVTHRFLYFEEGTLVGGWYE